MTPKIISLVLFLLPITAWSLYFLSFDYEWEKQSESHWARQEIASTSDNTVSGTVADSDVEMVADPVAVTHEELKWPKYTIRLWLDGKRKPIPKVTWATTEERARSLLKHYGKEDTFPIWKKYADKYKIDYTFAISIAFAETSMGWANKSKSNLCNVWNNDRWDVVHHQSIESGIKSCFIAFHWKYLKGYNQIKYLSWEGRTRAKLNGCVGRWDYCFATSKHHWETNVVNMVSVLKNEQVDGEFLFRIK